MLPVTFIRDPELRLSKPAVGIFAVAILAAGFSSTGLLMFAVRNATFQTDRVYSPALISCVVGLLTILYSFLLNKRYYWNTPAYLSIAVAFLGILAYSGLLIWTSRKTSTLRMRSERHLLPSAPPSAPPESNNSRESLVPRYQDSAYYDNYIRNMFPASARSPPAPVTEPTRSAISEEEMQRQQMLMLLQTNQAPTPASTQSTFRIDWQDQDQDEGQLSPARGYYAPGTGSNTSGSSGYPLSAISTQISGSSLQPWDGVWRDPMPASMQARSRAQVAGSREERRRQIESS